MAGETSPSLIRRGLLAGIVSSAALGTLAAAARAQSSFVTAADGTRLFVQEHGRGETILFVHGFTVNSDIWREQFAVSTAAGLRCIAYDRRGHGRSDKPERGFDYDTLADDLAAIIERFDLRRVTLVGHSMGAGEIVRYLTRYGTGRVAKVILVAPTTPLLVQRPDNPHGLPPASFDGLRAALEQDYEGFVRASVRGPGVLAPDTADDVINWVIGLSLQCSAPAAIACTHTYSETDFRTELSRITAPTLVLQGDADAMPLELTGSRTAALIAGSTLKVYRGAPHALPVTHHALLSADILAFMRDASR